MAKTGPGSNRLAIFFDFDDTLAPDSVNDLLKRVGADVEGWASA